jgi:hemerythrin-like domain-containing protein
MTPTEHHHSTRCWWNWTQARWECHSASDRETAPERPLTDVRDMIVVHTALLREFRLAPAAVEKVPPGDLRRARIVDEHIGFVCDLLHHHHTGEDELLWPKLRDRVPDAAQSVLDAVESQHGAIEGALDDVTAARSAWVATPGTSTGGTLSAALRRLHSLLTEHLDLEERAVLPLAASHVTTPEWRELGEVAVAAMPKAKAPLTFGMFAYEGDPAVLKDMLSVAPPVPRMLLPHLAPRVYGRRAKLVHGTRTP